ncbi:MAG: cation:proton antiporter [Candidatus Aenigmarchaeota archaeon]|nr:cation:proton antiporter [Candidatus Aenigmarchaeota archaeon]
MNFLLSLAVMLIAARIFGEIFERVNLPSILGYMVSGIVFGSVLNLIPIDHINDFGQIGLILLLFIVGFKEIDIEKLVKNKKPGILTGFLGAAITFILAYWLGLSFEFSFLTSLFLGLAIAETSISCSIASFINLDKINTRLGRAILGASVVDDILGLIALALVTSLAATGTLGLVELGNIVFGIFLFFIVFVAGGYAIPILMKKVKTFRSEEIRFSIVLAVIILVAYLADVVGLSVVLGAFLAGVMLSRSPELETREFSNDMAVVSHGIFIPLFFAWIGLQIMIIPEMIGMFSLLLILIAIFGKMFGACIAGILSRFNRTECLGLGIGMIPRGEVGLIVLAIGRGLGLIPDLIFSAVFLVIAVTVIITPVLLTFVLKNKELPG